MRRLNKVLASVTLVGVLALGGVMLTRQVLAVADEANAERLNRAVLAYIAEKNPSAPIKAFQRPNQRRRHNQCRIGILIRVADQESWAILDGRGSEIQIHAKARQNL